MNDTPSTAPQPGYFDTDRKFLDSYFQHPWALLLRRLRRMLGRRVLELNLPERARVIDFGCAHQQYRNLFPDSMQYVGVDLPGNPIAHAIILDDGSVPLPDAEADLVMSIQVLEHVSSPEHYIREAFRLLHPGGRLMLSTHGIFVYHADPVDYWRWTNSGLRKQVEDAGFKVVRFDGVIGQAGAGIQFFADTFFWRLPKFLRPVWVIFFTAMIAGFDRLFSDQHRRNEAIIFVLVAEKPA